MVITGKEEGYKLVLAGDRGFSAEEVEYRRTEVYDSQLRVWETAGEIPKNLELHSQEGALCGNVLYCLARDPKQGVWNTLAGFDVRERTWRVVSQTVPHGSRTPHVVACLGRILAIAEQDRVGSQDDSQCAILYELNLVSKKWRELSRLPSEMYVTIGKRVVACTVDGDYICITGCRAKRWYSVMCRSSESKWQQVPAFPVEDSKGSELLLSSSPFRPSLEPV